MVGKSTVPVGTAARLRDRLVLGVESEADHLVLRDVYAVPIRRGVPVFRTDLATAELAKVSANVMLAARISLVNLLAEVCEVSSADVGDLTDILGADPRIGSECLRPGLGYGGGCLPKDTRAFVARAGELVDLDRGPTVAVLGGAFKAGSDDVRDSPALAVAAELRRRGAHVRMHDPQADRNIRRVHPELEVTSDTTQAVSGAELVLVLTEWPEFAALDPVDLGRIVGRRAVIDGRLLLDPDTWRAADWDFHALGRGSEPARAAR